jgi:hypothetical protein
MERRDQASMAHAGGALCCRRDCGQIVAKPAPQLVPDAGVGFAEHEMTGIADEVQLGGLPGALEQLDGLLAMVTVVSVMRQSPAQKAEKTNCRQISLRKPIAKRVRLSAAMRGQLRDPIRR